MKNGIICHVFLFKTVLMGFFNSNQIWVWSFQMSIRSGIFSNYGHIWERKTSHPRSSSWLPPFQIAHQCVPLVNAFSGYILTQGFTLIQKLFFLSFLKDFCIFFQQNTEVTLKIILPSSFRLRLSQATLWRITVNECKMIAPSCTSKLPWT